MFRTSGRSAASFAVICGVQLGDDCEKEKSLPPAWRMDKRGWDEEHMKLPLIHS